MTDDELRAIEERAAEATPGPWKTFNDDLEINGKQYVVTDHDNRESLMVKESYQGNPGDMPFVAAARTDVPALCNEVRVSWAAIHDLRQDSEAYRRAIVDALRVMRNGYVADLLTNKALDDDEITKLIRAVANLALTKEEAQRVWDGDPAPLGVVYDADNGFRGYCVDAETGERLHMVKRCCPEQGWYEAYDTDANGEISRPPVVRRYWRKIRVEPYESKVTV